MKPGLAIALMRKKPPKQPESERYMEKQRKDDYELAFKDAASEALRHIKSGDTEKFAAALKAAIELCDNAEEY